MTKNRKKSRKTRQCPNCGYGKTGMGGKYRYCPQCRWTDKPRPKTEVKRVAPPLVIKSITKTSHHTHVPVAVGRELKCERCSATLGNVTPDDKQSAATKSRLINKAKTQRKGPKLKREH